MCAAGKVQYISSGAGNLTPNAEYDIVAVNADSGDVRAVIIDDNGDPFVATVTGGGAPFQVTQLYAPTKVV